MLPSVNNSEASQINLLGSQLSAIKRKEQSLLCRIDSIGSEMRERVAVIVEVADLKLTIIRNLLSLPKENRNFIEAEKEFKSLIETLDKDLVQCYKNLLDARPSYMQSGQQVMLTKEKKHELLLSFTDLIKGELSQVHLNLSQ